jgi:chorismate mutase-like protein
MPAEDRASRPLADERLDRPAHSKRTADAVAGCVLDIAPSSGLGPCPIQSNRLTTTHPRPDEPGARSSDIAWTNEGDRQGWVGILNMAAASPVEPDDLGSLVDLAAQRILVSDEVAATKFRSGAPVEDLFREGQVLAEAGRRAVQLGLDQELAIHFVRSQIYASKIVQCGLLARWQAHPEDAPCIAPDLPSIRERLDKLDEQLLEQLRRMRATHRLASLCRHLREVRNPVATARSSSRPNGPARPSELSAGSVARSRRVSSAVGGVHVGGQRLGDGVVAAEGRRRLRCLVV